GGMGWAILRAMRPRRLGWAVLVLVLVAGGLLTTVPAPALTAPTAPASRVPGGGAGPFPDVPDDHPFRPHIEWSVEQALVRGYPDGTFRPGVALSRGALAALLYRLVGPIEPGGPLTRPPDVPGDHPFVVEIRWAISEGVLPSGPDGRFRPGEPATRRELAAALHGLAGAPTPRPDAPAFLDVPGADPEHGAIGWTAWSRLLVGHPDGTYRPDAPLRRGAMAGVL